MYVSREFLKEIELPSDEVRESLAVMCMKIHTSVEEKSEQFYDELRRRVFTTPKSYLDLISLYIDTLKAKRAEMNIDRDRLATGLRKLSETNSSIADLKVKLKEMQPILVEKNENLKVTLEQVKKDKAVADEKEKVVMEEKQKVDEEAAKAQELQREANEKLDIARPMLENAVNAVNKLEKASLVEIKALNNPPEAVQTVMESIMILLGEKTSWDSVRKELGNPGRFLERL